MPKDRSRWLLSPMFHNVSQVLNVGSLKGLRKSHHILAKSASPLSSYVIMGGGGIRQGGETIRAGHWTTRSENLEYDKSFFCVKLNLENYEFLMKGMKTLAPATLIVYTCELSFSFWRISKYIHSILILFLFDFNRIQVHLLTN